MNNKFQYPIFPDRLYTITFDGQEYTVMGDILIALYAEYAGLDTPQF